MKIVYMKVRGEFFVDMVDNHIFPFKLILKDRFQMRKKMFTITTSYSLNGMANSSAASFEP